jgi:HAD superfamily hydrolase (TIGR01549 family)
MTDRPIRALVFDFDGTLVDSDAALVAPFLELGVPAEEISFGHAVAEDCERLGISLDAYVAAYDDSAARPFPGVDQVVARLGRWALCSNKHPRSGLAELRRLGWEPEVAVFADHFDWRHKSIGPVLEVLGLAADEVVMIGDSDGDLRCAADAGCRFVWAGWNPRVRAAEPDGPVLTNPEELLALYG